MIDDGQNSGFDQLGFHDGGDYLDQRFLREDDGAFRNGIDIAAEAEAGQILEKFLSKQTGTAQIVDFVRPKMQISDVFNHLFQTAGNRIAAAAGIFAVESVEDNDLVGALQKIALHHSQLIQVSQ